MNNKELINKAKFTDIHSLNLDLVAEGNRYRSKIHSSLIFTRTVEGFYIYSWNSRNLKGDLIHFAMNYYRLDFVGAVEHLTSKKFIISKFRNSKALHFAIIRSIKNKSSIKILEPFGERGTNNLY